MSIAIMKRKAKKLLNELMLNNNITYNDIISCAEKNMKKIENMFDIYDRKTVEDEILSFKLFKILSQDDNKKVIDYICEVFKISENIKNNKILSFIKEKDKDVELLITAFMGNPLFFYHAIDIYDEMKINAEKKDKIPAWDFERKSWLPQLAAAAAENDDYFLIKREYIEEKDFCGDLELLGIGNSNNFKVRFQFKDKNTNKPILTKDIPFYLDIDINFNSNNCLKGIKLEHKIESMEGTICSDGIPFNWSKEFGDITIKGKSYHV